MFFLSLRIGCYRDVMGWFFESSRRTASALLVLLGILVTKERKKDLWNHRGPLISLQEEASIQCNGLKHAGLMTYQNRSIMESLGRHRKPCCHLAENRSPHEKRACLMENNKKKKNCRHKLQTSVHRRR